MSKKVQEGANWDRGVTLNNEFAIVNLSLDYSNGVRLRVESVVTGRVVWLDPMQLESLTWLPEEVYTKQFESPFGPEE